MKASDKNQEVQFCVTQMGNSDNLLQNYRILFISIEAIFFGFAIAFRQLKIYQDLLYFIVAIGVICAVLWIPICYHRGKEVWIWRDKIIDLLKGTDLGIFTEHLWKGQQKIAWARIHQLTRYIFNFGIPLFLVTCWILFFIITLSGE